MDNSYTFDDIKLLLNRNKLIILIPTILMSLLLAAYLILDVTKQDEQVVEESIETSESEIVALLERDRSSLTDAEIGSINDYLNNNNYTFRAYIEEQDGRVFDNSSLLEAILIEMPFVEEILQQAETDFTGFEENVFDLNYNSNLEVHNIEIGTGDVELNETLSNAIYTAMEEGTVEVIDDKQVFLFETPAPVDSEQPNEEESNSEQPASNGFSITELVISLIVGASLGFGAGIIAAFLRAYFSKKISPIFNYRLTPKDMLINYAYKNQKKGNIEDEVIHSIMYPKVNSKLILVQNEKWYTTLTSFQNENNKSNLTIVHHVYEVDASQTFDEIIILTKNAETDKTWYLDEKNQLRTYLVPLKVIKV